MQRSWPASRLPTVRAHTRRRRRALLGSEVPELQWAGALPEGRRSQFFTLLLNPEQRDNDDFYLNLPAMHDLITCGLPVVPNVQVAPKRGDQFRDWKNRDGYTPKAMKFWQREFPGRPFPNSVPSMRSMPYSTAAGRVGHSFARNALGMLRFLRP